jgi:anti-anti-sigma factor
MEQRSEAVRVGRDGRITDGHMGIVVDLGELKYISSMGLRSFVSVPKSLRDKGGTLRLCRLNGLVKQVFEITGPSQSFPVYESVESAVLGGQRGESAPLDL